LDNPPRLIFNGKVVREKDGFMRNVFPGKRNLSVWLRENTANSGSYESFVLITASNSDGSSSVLVNGDRILDVQPSTFVQTPKERVVTDIERLKARIYSTYVILGYGFLILLITFSIFSFGGVIKARVVLTGSMEPVISPGDVVITMPVSRREPRVGDVVTYVAKRFDGSPVGNFTHRIISGDSSAGFIVKGDANPTPDIQRPKLPDIAGVVIFTIPFIGTLMTPRALAILVPTLFGIWLVVDALRKRD
jgi:signal peptidase I